MNELDELEIRSNSELIGQYEKIFKKLETLGKERDELVAQQKQVSEMIAGIKQKIERLSTTPPHIRLLLKLAEGLSHILFQKIRYDTMRSLIHTHKVIAQEREEELAKLRGELKELEAQDLELLKKYPELLKRIRVETREIRLALDAESLKTH